ncbi:MAG TPA: flagellar biosynthetic protein FliO [Acetobacteraceae bacterium]|nr:flagellar biosynthetic protein FliO [Acetobacteraceae bacterium]
MYGFDFHIVSSLIALAAVLALIWLAARGARRFGFAPRGGGTRRLTLAETLPLDARRRLHLIRCDGRELLLLTGGGNDAVIGWLAHSAPRPEPEA